MCVEVPGPTTVPQGTIAWLEVVKAVEDMSIRPAGRKPLSRSSSVS